MGVCDVNRTLFLNYDKGIRLLNNHWETVPCVKYVG